MASYGTSEINYKLFYYPHDNLEAIDRTDAEIRCRIWYALSRMSGEHNSQTIDKTQVLKLINNFEFFKTLSVDAKNSIVEKSPRFLFDAD